MSIPAKGQLYNFSKDYIENKLVSLNVKPNRSFLQTIGIWWSKPKSNPTDNELILAKDTHCKWIQLYSYPRKQNLRDKCIHTLFYKYSGHLEEQYIASCEA